MTLHGCYTELQKRERERKKKRGGARTRVSRSPRIDPVRISTDFDGKERERRKREGVLEPMYLEARDLTRSVFLRTLLEKRERGRKERGSRTYLFRGP